MDVVLFTGTEAACRKFFLTVERGDFVTLGFAKDGDTWQVVGLPLENPTPEEIEAMLAPMREEQKRNPRYSDTLDNRRMRKTDTVAAQYSRIKKTFSALEEKQFKVPQGWRP